MGILDKIYRKNSLAGIQRKLSALREAQRISKILGQKFGAKKVLLYGSLLREKAVFDNASDIDLAVEGLSGKFLRAYGYCLRISRYPIDLKEYDILPEKFRREILKNGRSLYERKHA
ncbi:MAG: nucleotidyltransferase domain-containing protein [Candidatus Omnitrophica bacterium]|nr:nucleotidyltransferase domain-containing protein [Candidatus Omnitrophota bacterium]